MNDTGDDIQAENARWSFAGDTSKNFDTHVRKSVPLYEEGHQIVVKLTDYFLGHDSLCYEFGTSTGQLVSKMAEHNKGKNVRFIGVDIEEDMVALAKERTKQFSNVDILNSDLSNIDLESCDMVIAYYTIQFIHPKIRQDIFTRIFESLNWGGAFVLFEKVRAPDARFQDISTGLYTEYKIDQGYEPPEIIAKTRSLKGVLEPFSTQGNIDLMKRAGFVDITTIMKYVCFEGFLAIK